MGLSADKPAGEPRPTKVCAECGVVFEKPKRRAHSEWAGRKFCSAACERYAIRNAPFLHAEVVPCRICGGDTRYRGAPSVADRVVCDNPECRQRSYEIRMARIRAALAERKRRLGETGSSWWR